MLLRPDGEAVIAIGQPAHAWVSGQLARAWGNERFGEVEPREEVLLAAEQHDVGMAAWDAAPELNPSSGLPYGFTEMPLATHLALWERAPGLALAQSPYAALLLSMHGTALYEMRDLAVLPRDESETVRAYLDGQRRLQADLREALEIPEAQARRNQRLLWTWDYLSLALCLDWAPGVARGVPAAEGELDVRLERSGSGEDPGRLTLDPWPFDGPQAELRVDGRRLEGRFEDETSLRAALGTAPWISLRWTLTPR